MNKMSRCLAASLVLSLVCATAEAQNVVQQSPITLSGTDFQRTAGTIELSDTALPSITNDILSVVSGVLKSGSGTTSPVYGTGAPQVLSITYGTTSVPIVTSGTQIRILYRHDVPNSECFGNSSDTGCIAPLLINAQGGASTNMVTSAATFYADTLSTAGMGIGNAQAINAVSLVSGGSTAAAMGAYISGRRESTTGSVVGAEISSWNRTDVDCAAPIITGESRCVGIWLVSRGNDLTSTVSASSSGIQFGKGNDYGIFREGITFNLDTVRDRTLNDQSSSETSLYIGGVHTYALESASDAGYFGFGKVAPLARVDIGGNLSASAWSGSGVGLRISSTTFTDTSSSGTVADNYVNSFLAPTLAASSATTYTNAATFSVNKPIAGTNVTLTNAYAIRSGGPLLVSGGLLAMQNSISTADVGDGSRMQQWPATVTDTVGTGTVAANNVNYFPSTTLAALSPTTYTEAAAMRIVAPTAGTNVTLTNSYALVTNGQIKSTNLPTTGTAAASLCIDSAGNIFKKTTTGACL